MLWVFTYVANNVSLGEGLCIFFSQKMFPVDNKLKLFVVLFDAFTSESCNYKTQKRSEFKQKIFINNKLCLDFALDLVVAQCYNF